MGKHSHVQDNLLVRKPLSSAFAASVASRACLNALGAIRICIHKHNVKLLSGHVKTAILSESARPSADYPQWHPGRCPPHPHRGKETSRTAPKHPSSYRSGGGD